MYFWFDLFLSYSTKNQQLFKRLKGQSLYSKAQWKSGKAAELMLVEEHQENKESGEHQEAVEIMQKSQIKQQHFSKNSGGGINSVGNSP